MTAARALYGEFVRTFGNVLFAVSLFVVWGLLTLVGVIVDQGQDPNLYFQSYAAPLARAILRLNFDNVYHSPWYVGIVGLILLSLAVCTFKRVIPARLPPLRPVNVEKIALHATFEAEGDADEIRRRLAEALTARGWRMRERIFDGVEWSFADKHNWARRGVLVAHAGFVIIAAGTTLYWARGFSGDIALLTGETSQVPRTHALVRLDDFRYEIAPIMTKSGMVYQPIDYVSHVTVTGNDGIPKHLTVRVNHPIDVDGTLYYQASYGFGMQFLVTHDGRRDALSRRARCSRASRSTFPVRSAACSTSASRPPSISRAARRPPIRASTTRRSCSPPRMKGTRSAKLSCRSAPGSISATAGARFQSATCSTAVFNTGTTRECRSLGSARSCCSRAW